MERYTHKKFLLASLLGVIITSVGIVTMLINLVDGITEIVVGATLQLSAIGILLTGLTAHKGVDSRVSPAPKIPGPLTVYFSYNGKLQSTNAKKILESLRTRATVIDPFDLVPLSFDKNQPDYVRNKCMEAVEASDTLVAFIPEPYFYIGLIAEMEHAKTKQIPIYVITANSEVAERTWIRALATKVVQTPEEIPLTRLQGS